MPFRKLGDQHQRSGKQAFLKVDTQLRALPKNESLTKDLCDPSRYCGLLILDGKYATVKGYEKKIPFIYGIDYLTHDIPYGDLFVSEDYQAFYQFFRTLKEELKYPLRAVIADDRKGLKTALNQHFPYAKLQLCHTHYLENLRQLLNIRTDEKYYHFFFSLIKRVFRMPRTNQEVMAGLKHVFEQHASKNRMLANLIFDIRDRREELFAYLQIQNCPNSTNLVELYNSHLQGRLKTIKGFESFVSARRWLNAYLIRRRTKPLTDCMRKFKHLNGLAALQMTIRDLRDYPIWIPGVKVPKQAPKR